MKKLLLSLPLLLALLCVNAVAFAYPNWQPSGGGPVVAAPDGTYTGTLVSDDMTGLPLLWEINPCQRTPPTPAESGWLVLDDADLVSRHKESFRRKEGKTVTITIAGGVVTRIK